MLEVIREKMQGVFATVIVAVLCAIFALWGVETLFDRGGNREAVATVNGVDIFEPELDHAIDTMRRQYMKMLGNQVDASFLNDQLLRNPALESLISRKLLDAQTQTLGLSVGTRTVEKAIVQDPVFSRDGKTFDPEYYKEMLRNSQVTAAAYQKQLRQQLVFNHLQDGVSGTAFITDAQVAHVARLQGQERHFEYLRLPLQKWIDQAVVKDEEVAAYYESHKNDFMTEEKVAVEYLELNKETLAKDIVIAESDVRDAYDKETAAFQPAIERRASHILVEEKPDNAQQAVLDKIRQQLAEGKDFAALAKEFSVDEGSASQGGDVGFSSGSTFVPEFETALAGLANVGDVSAPVKTEFGYHIIKLTEKRQTSMPPFEKRQAALEQELRQSRAGTAFTEKLDQLAELTYSAGDLAGPAKELGIELQKTPLFSKRGGVGVAAQPKVIEAAFSADLLGSGKNSAVIDVSGDRSLVLRVVEHQLPAARDLAEVKPDILAILKREQATKALATQAEQWQQQAVAAGSLAPISKEERAKLVTVVAKSRSAGGEEAELYEAAYQLPRPAEGAPRFTVVALGNGDRALLALTSVVDPDVQPGSEAWQQVRQQLEEAVARSDFSAYERQLESQAEITRKPAPAPAAPPGKP